MPNSVNPCICWQPTDCGGERDGGKKSRVCLHRWPYSITTADRAAWAMHKLHLLIFWDFPPLSSLAMQSSVLWSDLNPPPCKRHFYLAPEANLGGAGCRPCLSAIYESEASHECLAGFFAPILLLIPCYHHLFLLGDIK